MIIATVTAILLIFGSSDNGFFGKFITEYVEDPIKNTIVDEERRKLALESLSLLKDDIEEFNKQNAEAIEQFKKMVKNYDSRPEDFNKMFSSMLSERQKQADLIWEHRSNLLIHIQAKEWKRIITSAKAAAQGN